MTDKIRKRRRRPRNTGRSATNSNTDASKQNDGEYSVGYGKPPQNTQFKPSQSGNPRGRPRGSKNLATLIDEELSSKVAVNEGGRRRTLSKGAVIAKRFVNKAAEGDIRTVQTLFKVQESSLTGPDPIGEKDEEETLAPDDRAILKAYESKLMRSLKQSATNSKHPSQSTRKRPKK